MAAKVATTAEIVKETTRHLNTTVDDKHITKVTEHGIHYSDGSVEFSILVKQTPIDTLTRKKHTLKRLSDGTWVTTKQQPEMDDTHHTQTTTVRTQCPDGTIGERTTVKRTALKDIFGYDFTNYHLEDPEEALEEDTDD
ncbi:hypothetical protein NKR19_g3831 [Coniochaeta hoffmannii]|uniref:Uncharacterized protein n=1 Tax=Coniochaeta hoffmannii TaxID=91930 RepID=A0AA38VXP3_9PEZI|nr:hypothetical protein NKR19_g3831 [Coniochaeta hoffmannii]